MLRQDLQRLKNSVNGRTVFILGGGSSVTPEILSLLNDSNVKIFALNSSVKYVNNPIGLLWCDDSWAATNLDHISKLSCPKFYVRMHASSIITSDTKGIGNSTILNKTGQFGYEKDINCVRGNNSGANAINLLVNCGARVIGLVGFDMNVSLKNKAHFHSDYSYAIRPSVYPDLFIPSIVSMNEEMNKAACSTKIYNCNPYSALKCYEFKNIKELI